MRRWDSLTEKGIYMKSWPLATLHLTLVSAFLFVNKFRQRRQISACCQGTGPFAQRVLLFNKVCVMNIHRLLANTGYNAGPQSCTFPRSARWSIFNNNYSCFQEVLCALSRNVPNRPAHFEEETIRPGHALDFVFVLLQQVSITLFRNELQ